ncbi:DUF6395 domain-containing protein [Glycomyces albidus]|uniref:Glycosyltransferase n=1 Tax=Glycomyces albidus TaxID=2656774 RepID=A0A6L5GH05_9ACTN|nr:DUF6395 domain-containing protein [Glycomyces albidus]MQM28987.1 glycosyltransferase [Glycomyces albidus]
MRIDVSTQSHASGTAVEFRIHRDGDDRETAYDGAILEGDRVITVMPPEWSAEATHPDLIGLAALASVQPWVGARLTLNRPVSAQLADRVREVFEIELGPVDAALAGRDVEIGTGRPGIAYTGGVDSAALAALLPQASLYFLNRSNLADREIRTKYRADAALASCEDMRRLGRLVRVVDSNVEYIRTPIGAPVHEPSELSFAIPVILMADVDGLDAIGVGAVAVGAYGLGYERFTDIDADHPITQWAAVTEAVGLGSVNAVAGLGEVITAKITMQTWGERVLVQSCVRGEPGQPCKRCWKCFRKTLIDSAITGAWPDDAWLDEVICSREISARLLEIPIYSESSLLFSLQQYRGRHPLLLALKERLRCDEQDFGLWARYYGPAIDIVAKPYRAEVKERLEAYAEPMTEAEAERLRGWRNQEARFSFTAVKARDEFALRLAERSAESRLVPLSWDKPTGKARAYPQIKRERSPRAVEIRRNDHSVLDVPDIGEWTPGLSVSIVIPAYRDQEKLDLTLAALAAQTYPADLTEVVVVDDGSEPPLRLPDIRPENCRLLRNDTRFWGSANAVNIGVRNTTGDVVLRLDADMIVFPGHVESHMRWHHLIDNAAIVGQKKFVTYESGALTPAQVYEAARDGRCDELFRRSFDSWSEALFDRTERMAKARTKDAYKAFVGATGSVNRDLFATAGGLAEDMVLGGDTEFAYRLALAGAVFIPDDGPQGRSWHLGIPQMKSNPDSGSKFRRPLVMHRVPDSPHRPALGHLKWEVPFADVVVDTRGFEFETVVDCVAPLLSGTRTDIRLFLVGDWPGPLGPRQGTIEHPQLDAFAVQEVFRHDERIHLVKHTPVAAPSVPWRLLLPCGVVPTADILSTLVDLAEEHGKGLVTVDLPGGGRIRLEWRPAFARAAWHGALGSDIDQKVKDLFGAHRLKSLHKAVYIGGYSKDPVERLAGVVQRQKTELDELREELALTRKRNRALEQRKRILEQRLVPERFRRVARRLLAR